MLDGNGGITPFPSPTLNLVEPNPPTPFVAGGGPAIPDPGDNLDALDMDNGPSLPVYFSLDGNFADPLEAGAVPPNTATAGANGFLASDILVSPGGGGPIGLYAPTAALGADACWHQPRPG